MSYGPTNPVLPHAPRACGVSSRGRGGAVGGGGRRLHRSAFPLPGRTDRALPGDGRGGGLRLPAGGGAAPRGDQRHPVVRRTPRPAGIPPPTPGRGGRRSDPERSRRDRLRAAGTPRLADLRLRRALRYQHRGCPRVSRPGGRRHRAPFGHATRRAPLHQEGVGAPDRSIRALPPGVPPSRQVRVDRIRRRGGRGRDGLREAWGGLPPRLPCLAGSGGGARHRGRDAAWIAAGADVFKLEGRELSPPAVAALVTRFRRKLDAVLAGSGGGGQGRVVIRP